MFSNDWGNEKNYGYASSIIQFARIAINSIKDTALRLYMEIAIDTLANYIKQQQGLKNISDTRVLKPIK